MKIYDKKFLRFVAATQKDIKAQGFTDFANELKNILETKELTLINVSTLFQFLQYREETPSHYDVERDQIMQKTGDARMAFTSVAQLKKEHKYMMKIISKYFSYQEHENGTVQITKKYEEVA